MAKPIVFHPVYARLTGSLQAGLMLSHAVAQPAAGFYKNAEEWEDESTLTYSNQKTGRKRLTEVRRVCGARGRAGGRESGRERDDVIQSR